MLIGLNTLDEIPVAFQRQSLARETHQMPWPTAISENVRKLCRQLLGLVSMMAY